MTTPVPSSVRVRPAALADAEIIAHFNERLAEETEHLVLDPARIRAGVTAALLDPAKGRYYLAVDGQRVVGQTMITFEWSDWRNGNFWWLQSVYVHPEYRQRGVFKLLFRTIEQEARAHANVCGLRLYVEGDNLRAQQTYAALGMEMRAYRFCEIDFVLH